MDNRDGCLSLVEYFHCPLLAMSGHLLMSPTMSALPPKAGLPAPSPTPLGQSSIGITMDLYTHVLPGMQEEAAERVDNALRAALKNGSPTT